ncbi:aspartate kinase [Clostridium tetani]|uniref:aspartate kinase n=1 Tax=Clostridium tetani TaxID=1513 RepID=UPI00100B111B|nr:aspartate kinase [Clostridium tetani]RXM70337.1 aspartate kinase [Clostridium tetani]
MTMVQKENLKKILKEFNEKEMGGGYLYFLHQKQLVQLDLVDYSTCIVCDLEDILHVEFYREEEGIYLDLQEKYEGIDSCWIYENGVEM